MKKLLLLLGICTVSLSSYSNANNESPQPANEGMVINVQSSSTASETILYVRNIDAHNRIKVSVFGTLYSPITIYGYAWCATTAEEDPNTPLMDLVDVEPFMIYLNPGDTEVTYDIMRNGRPVYIIDGKLWGLNLSIAADAYAQYKIQQ